MILSTNALRFIVDASSMLSGMVRTGMGPSCSANSEMSTKSSRAGAGKNALPPALIAAADAGSPPPPPTTMKPASCALAAAAADADADAAADDAVLNPPLDPPSAEACSGVVPARTGSLAGRCDMAGKSNDGRRRLNSGLKSGLKSEGGQIGERRRAD